jgi:putative transposase
VLNAEWLNSAKQAQVAINLWLKHYNQIRPHHGAKHAPANPKDLMRQMHN